MTTITNTGVTTTDLTSNTLETAGDILINTTGNPSLTVKTSGAGNNPFVRIQADTNYWDLQSIFSNTNDELDFRYNGSSKMMMTKDGIITEPNQPMLALQPDSTGVNTVPSSQSNYTHIVGWKVVGGRQTFLRSGLTLSGTTHGYYLANGNNTGRITFSTSGIYYFDCTIRIENVPGSGNIYVRYNGNTIHRMHVEAWGRYPYAHGRVSRCVSASAGDYIEFGVACPTGGNFSGSGDTVNWLTIMKVA